MQAILLSREEVARRAKQLYESSIRQKVETEDAPCLELLYWMNRNS
jgi:hypothetical protein